MDTHSVDVVITSKSKNNLQNSSTNVVPIVRRALKAVGKIVRLVDLEMTTQCSKAATHDEKEGKDLDDRQEIRYPSSDSRCHGVNSA